MWCNEINQIDWSSATCSSAVVAVVFCNSKTFRVCDDIHSSAAVRAVPDLLQDEFFATLKSNICRIGTSVCICVRSVRLIPECRLSCLVATVCHASDSDFASTVPWIVSAIAMLYSGQSGCSDCPATSDSWKGVSGHWSSDVRALLVMWVHLMAVLFLSPRELPRMLVNIAVFGPSIPALVPALWNCTTIYLSLYWLVWRFRSKQNLGGSRWVFFLKHCAMLLCDKTAVKRWRKKIHTPEHFIEWSKP